MSITAESNTQADTLREIADQLKLLTAAVNEQNQLINACIQTPDGQIPRLVTGIAGIVETLGI